MKKAIIAALLTASCVFGAACAASYSDTEGHWAEAYIDMLSEQGLINGMENGMYKPEELITTEQLTAIMLRAAGSFSAFEEYDEDLYKEHALNMGIITDYDIINWKNAVERRSAARIIHQTMYYELGERDADDWSAAEALADLYSCNTCVNHIAQVYVKGIMQGREEGLFDLYSSMTRAEAAAVTARMIDSTLRLPADGSGKVLETVSYDEALSMIDKGAVLIDVRSEEEYGKGHLPGSMNIPLARLMDDIESAPLPEDSETPLIVYCSYGIKSAKAAGLLTEAGRIVYDLGGMADYCE